MNRAQRRKAARQAYRMNTRGVPIGNGLVTESYRTGRARKKAYKTLIKLNRAGLVYSKEQLKWAGKVVAKPNKFTDADKARAVRFLSKMEKYAGVMICQEDSINAIEKLRV